MKKTIFLAVILGAIAGGIIGYQQMSTLTFGMEQQLIAQFGNKQAIIFISMVQTTIFTLIAAVVGKKLSTKTNLDKSFKFHKKALYAALIVGLTSALVISLSEKLIFVKLLALTETYEFSGLYLLSSLIYGGIVEEVMLRWGLMTFIVWIGSKIIHTNESKNLYMFAIIFSAMIFAIGHLPATAQLLGLSNVTVLRAMILNFIPGIGFGYLYWKHGIGYAIIGHMATHLINQLILLPLLF